MMAEFSYSLEEARRIVADYGLIARVASQGAALYIYDGEEDEPCTWMEVNRIAINNGRVLSSALQAVL